jgi:hypothetical protein
MVDLASRVSRGDWPMLATLVRSVFEQPDRDATWAQLGDVIDKLTATGFVDPAVYLLDAADDILPFSAFPVEHWPRIRPDNPQERLNKEIRRRTDVVGIFPHRRAVIRLMGAILAEQTDEWLIAKPYISVESLKIPALTTVSPEDPRPATPSRPPLGDPRPRPPTKRGRTVPQRHRQPLYAHAHLPTNHEYIPLQQQSKLIYSRATSRLLNRSAWVDARTVGTRQLVHHTIGLNPLSPAG